MVLFAELSNPLQTRICCTACSIQCKQHHLMRRVRYGKALSYRLCRQLLPRRGEMMLYMHLLCNKKKTAELEKMHLVWMDFGCGGVCSALSRDRLCLTPLPCSPGEADFLLALVSQRAEIPLESSGKAVTYCYEQI